MIWISNQNQSGKKKIPTIEIIRSRMTNKIMYSVSVSIFVEIAPFVTENFTTEKNDNEIVRRGEKSRGENERETFA